MKKIVWFCLLLPIILAACKNDSLATGQSLIDSKTDAIIVCADTFALTSQLRECDNIISSPDSFLLGEVETTYGVLRTDILTQLACPVGYQYPAGAELDSMLFILYYTSTIGDPLSPMSFTAYEMDRATLYYGERYWSDLEIADYCSMEGKTRIFEHDPIIVPGHPTDTIVQSGIQLSSIKVKVSSDFASRFFAIRNFSTQEAFNELFHGLYITPVFGSSNIINITTMALAVYYHFPFSYIDPDSGTRCDTVSHSIKNYYANSEVRQVNHIDYLNREALLDSLRQEQHIYNYVVSPAGVYTQLKFPMREMQYTIEKKIGEHKRGYINKAQLKVNVIYDLTTIPDPKNRDTWGMPAKQMLLLRDTLVERYFENKELLTTDGAILSELLTGKDENGFSYYYYSFDLSTLLSNQLRNGEEDTLRMTMVPVAVQNAATTNGSAYVSAVKESQSISNTVIYSPQNPATPMSLEVVYSGF